MTAAPAATGAPATRVASVSVSEAPARKRVRIALGAVTLLLALIALIRVPYVGEAVDGVVVDLLLFGTAKYAFYALAFAVGALMCLPSRRRLRPVATKRFALWSLAVLGLLAGACAVYDFYARWGASPTVPGFVSGYFSSWTAAGWAHGRFLWDGPFFASGGMWWALVAGINAGAPAVLLFALLALILAGLVLALLLRLRVRGVERLRRIAVAWLGGHWRPQGKPTAPPPPPPGGGPRSPQPEEAAPATVSAPPAATGQTSGQTGSRATRETPFSVLFADRRGRPFSGVIQGRTEDARPDNDTAARRALAKLTDLFVSAGVPGRPKGWRAGPTQIALEWDASNAPEAGKAASALKREMSAALGSSSFDVFMGEGGVLSVRFPAPLRSKIALADVQGALRPAKEGLTAAAGWNDACEPLALDLLAAGVTLVAGDRGSGRSMFLSSALLSVLTAYSPAELMVGVVDTRGTHLERFEGVSHLVAPIPGDVDAAYVFLDRVLHELKYRAKLLRESGAATFFDYNALPGKRPLKRLLLVLGDAADLLSANRAYALNLLNVLRSRARDLGCAVVLASEAVAPFLRHDAANAYAALVGFRANEPDCRARVCRDRLARLSGRGEFLVFANGADGLRETGGGQAAFVDDRELRRLVQALSDGGA